MSLSTRPRTLSGLFLGCGALVTICFAGPAVAADSPFRTATTKKVISEDGQTKAEPTLSRPVQAKQAVLRRAPGSPTSAQLTQGPARVVVGYYGPSAPLPIAYQAYYSPWYVRPYYHTYAAPTAVGYVGYYGAPYYYGYYAPARYYGPYYGGWCYW